jgi:hypothetical protein
MKSQFTNAQIEKVMSERGIAHKSAMKFLRREHGGTKAAVAPAKDVKMAAANDKPEVQANGDKFIAHPTKAPTPTMTPEQRGKARAEGLRLFVLAGNPKKQDFVKVFGKKGPAWTWEARAKAIGLASAEQCAAKFQSLLKKAL